MPRTLKVRIADGSVIDLDQAEMRSWYESGLLNKDSQVQKAGSREWQHLAQAMDVRQWRVPPKPKGVSVPAKASRPLAAAMPRALPPRARPWARYAAMVVGIMVVAGALYATSGWWLTAILGSPGERRVRAATLPTRRLDDEALGLRVELPRGWSMLKDDHGFFTVPETARLALAEPAGGAFGFLTVETPARGFASLDAYLEHALEERRRAEPSLRAVRQEEATGGARRLFAARDSGETEVEEVTTVWKDGWTYYALVVWAPAERARAAPLAAALRQGVTTAGPMGVRLREAIAAVSAEVPLLTPAAAEMLMGQSQAQVLEPPEAFRRTYLLVGKGLPALDKAEEKEMGALSSELYGKLPGAARARLGAYIERVRSGRPTDPAQDQAMSALVKGAAERMPAPRRVRLQALFEKAIAAAAGTSFGG